MSVYQTTRYQCRCIRAALVYSGSTDAKPSRVKIKIGDEFISRVQYVSDGFAMYQVAEAVNGDPPIGYWVSPGVLDVRVVEPPDPTEGVTENKSDVPTTSGRPSESQTSADSKSTKDADQRRSLRAGDNVTMPDGQDVTLKNYTADDNSTDMNQAITNTIRAMDDYRVIYETTSTTLQGAPIGRLNFVHGMPFQYDYITDRRLGSSHPDTGKYVDNMIGRDLGTGIAVSHYGRSFAEEISAALPIVVISSGKPRFLTRVNSGNNSSDVVKDTFFPLFAGNGIGQEISETLHDIGGSYDYYTIDIKMSEYYEYVNSMCVLLAGNMGLESGEGGTINGKVPTLFDWGEYNSSAEQDFSTWEDVIGLSGGVSYVYDPTGSVSDTISNGTGESSFASMFNEMSSMAKEMDFILGYSGSSIDINQLAGVKEAQAKLSEQAGPFGIGNVMSNVVTWVSNSAKGFNIRFPEIWQDSSYSRSYSVDLHFISPYATMYCIWRYVLVPFIHCFAAAAPISNSNNSQYKSPFLVRVFSKGYFNVEMGIIESITWKRFGEGDMITEDGYPTQIDVSIQFKDMYHALAITSAGIGGFNTANFLNNSGLMEMLGTISGVNMNRRDVMDRIGDFMNTVTHGLEGMPGNIKRSIQDSLRSAYGRIFRWK